jgi:hypothetical protein
MLSESLRLMFGLESGSISGGTIGGIPGYKASVDLGRQISPSGAGVTWVMFNSPIVIWLSEKIIERVENVQYLL